MAELNSSVSDRSDDTLYRSALDNSGFGSESDTTQTASEMSSETLENTLQSNDESSVLMADDEKTLHTPEASRKRKHSHEEVIMISSDDETETAAASTSTTTTVAEKPAMEPQRSTEIKIYSSLEEFDRNLPPTVNLLTTPHGSRVYLVGTAHYSEESQNDVSLVIRNVRPRIVVVELCGSRIHILKYDEKTLLEEAKDINMSKLRNAVQSNGVVIGLLFILLLNISAKLTEQLGMAPGGEFRRALEEAQKLPHCMLHLGDRPINVTLQRSLHGLTFWQTLKLVWRLITSDLKINKEEVENCKQSDLLQKLMEEMAGEFPAFETVFVKERDLYLCHTLQMAASTPLHPGEPLQPINVVGVVGIGHSAGIMANWGKVDSRRIAEILVIPPPTMRGRIIRATIKYGFLGAVGYGLYRAVRPLLPRIL
ncbi:traB domain-containing protein [Phlebotomus argentipes]|uniref:traB domain-containing protein n=1 Tax=Phlebotomus argentipes TaxID=94469 RepID=UPI0028932C47|nr:traB domain-containing protein [Phlebotomus argentipes]